MNFMKRFFTFILVVVIPFITFAQMWDGTAATWTKGDGTKDNPYLIETPAHLAFLSEQVGANKQTFEGKFFLIANELNMGASEGKVFYPIGLYDEVFDPDKNETVNSSLMFKGTLNGNNKVISNIKIQLKDGAEIPGTALFAAIDAPAHIHNLVLGKDSEVVGYEITAGIVAWMNGGVVENCLSQGKVNGTINTGGVVAVAQGAASVKTSMNAASITGTLEVGGVVGSTAGTARVSSCVNIGTVLSTQYGGGGIVGTTFEESFVGGSYNVGHVSGGANQWVASPHAVVASKDGNSQMENNYYATDKSNVDDPNATGKTVDEMKTEEFVQLLNGDINPAPFVLDAQNINNGFPLLAWIAQYVGGTSGISDEVTADKVEFTIHGLSLEATRSVAVYNLNGALIGQGVSILLPSAGVYVVKDGAIVSKILVQ